MEIAEGQRTKDKSPIVTEDVRMRQDENRTGIEVACMTMKDVPGTTIEECQMISQDFLFL